MYGKKYHNPNKKYVLLSAFTGIAAYAIKGETIHSAFKIQLKGFKRLTEPEIQRHRNQSFESVKLIIIDEMSMMGSNLFSNIDERLRQIYSNNSPFGGVNVLLLGDFYQLPPIKDVLPFQLKKLNVNANIENHRQLAFDSVNPLWRTFKLFELTEIMRQRGEIRFTNALHNFARYGKDGLTDDQLDCLNSCVRSEEEIDNLPENTKYLFFTNNAVRAYNIQALEKLPGDSVFINHAIHTFEGEVSEVERNRQKSIADKQDRDVIKLPNNLHLKVNGHYMISHINLDVSDGLCNGTCGKLKLITYATNTFGTDKQQADRLWLEYGDPTIGKKHRAKHNLSFNR